MEGRCMDVILILSFGIFPIAESLVPSYLDKHFSRQEEKIFLCFNRPDGSYALPNSFKYLLCNSGIALIRKCANDEIYVPSCKKCLVQIYAQRGSFCSGRVATSSVGSIIKYQNPWNCESWFECLLGVPTEYFCASGTQFSPEDQSCVISAKECKQARKIAERSNSLFHGKPNEVDAALLWSEDRVLLVDESTYYKLNENAVLMPGFPITLNDHQLSGIPQKIDASLSLPGDRLYFFKGKRVWLWGSDINPRHIKNEFEGVPDHLDAAFYWPYSKKAYFFKKDYFYRFDPSTKSVDFGYPKRITDGWPGASASIDAAVSLKNGTIFLFQKTGVLTFNPPLCKEEKSFISNIKDSTFAIIMNDL